MTWFEAEQIEMYLENLESQLDQWLLDAVQMRVETAELNRAIRSLEAADRNARANTPIGQYISDLHIRITDCRQRLAERLKR